MAFNTDYFNFSFNQDNSGVGRSAPRNPAEHRDWVVDSGAAGNSTYIGDMLQDIKRISSRQVVSADGGRSSTTIEGNVNTHGLLAKKVLYIPAIDNNLLSVGCLTRDDHVVVFHKHGCEIYNESDVFVKGIVKARGRLGEDGLYKLIQTDDNRNLGCYNRNLWHRRLGHLDMTNILILQTFMATGITLDEGAGNIECLIPACHSFFEYKHCPVYEALFDYDFIRQATKALELVYFYISSSLCDTSLNGNKNYIVFIDDYTRKSFVYFFRTEFEIVQKLIMFQKYVEVYTGNKIMYMVTNFDLENTKYYPYLDSFVSLNNINLIYSREDIPMIIWLRFYITTKTLCLLSETSLPNSFWAEMINAIVNLLNVTPNAGHPYTTPQEAWTGLKPDLSVARVFGCKAYLPCLRTYVIHLGYDFDRHVYRFLDVSHFGIYFRKNAIFYEDVQFCKNVD